MFNPQHQAQLQAAIDGAATAKSDAAAATVVTTGTAVAAAAVAAPVTGTAAAEPKAEAKVNGPDGAAPAVTTPAVADIPELPETLADTDTGTDDEIPALVLDEDEGAPKLDEKSGKDAKADVKADAAKQADGNANSDADADTSMDDKRWFKLRPQRARAYQAVESTLKELGVVDDKVTQESIPSIKRAIIRGQRFDTLLADFANPEYVGGATKFIAEEIARAEKTSGGAAAPAFEVVKHLLTEIPELDDTVRGLLRAEIITETFHKVSAGITGTTEADTNLRNALEWAAVAMAKELGISEDDFNKAVKETKPRVLPTKAERELAALKAQRDTEATRTVTASAEKISRTVPGIIAETVAAAVEDYFLSATKLTKDKVSANSGLTNLKESVTLELSNQVKRLVEKDPALKSDISKQIKLIVAGKADQTALRTLVANAAKTESRQLGPSILGPKITAYNTQRTARAEAAKKVADAKPVGKGGNAISQPAAVEVVRKPGETPREFAQRVMLQAMGS